MWTVVSPIDFSAVTSALTTAACVSIGPNVRSRSTSIRNRSDLSCDCTSISVGTMSTCRPTTPPIPGARSCVIAPTSREAVPSLKDWNWLGTTWWMKAVVIGNAVAPVQSIG